MELIINKSTYTLKSVNSERRQLFVDKVLSNYNYQSASFEDFMIATKDVLEKDHNIKMSLPQVKINFFKQYGHNVLICIWSFLTPEDKKELKTIENLDISQDEIKKFIESVSAKIVEYVKFVKSNSASGSKEDLEVIYSYLSKAYGWTFDYIREMDELDLMKAIDQAIVLNKKENLDQINSQALAGAYAGGSKKAKSQIDKMNKSLVTELNIKQLKKTNPNLEMKNELTREQIQAIMDVEANNG